MNFGPLNRVGGERRLNVAMTRARSEMLVYSTLSPDRIDLSRSQARAVADLKHFLEYAERGPSALGAAVYGSIGDFESPFESAVARALREKGWDVHPQVGVSAYRIDLGIVHPDKPGVYLAGIECDGAMYHSSAFARERDKIRTLVLKGLDWTLFRVWSTDWWTHRAKALDVLHELLNAHLEIDRQKRKEATEARDTDSTNTSSDPDVTDVINVEIAVPISFADVVADEMDASAPDFEPPEICMANDFTKPETSAGEILITQTLEFPGDQLNDGRHCYVVANLDGGHYAPDPAMFYSEEYKRRLSIMIDHVIDTEGPIHEDVLVRRIARHHGFQRAGRQIHDIVVEIAKRRRGRTKEDVGLFFWCKGTVKERLTPARHKGRDEEMRKVEYICKEEICAIRDLQSIGNDPIEWARRIGIARLSEYARKRLSKVLK
jgi:very-short-patch-repair endonuclease